KKAGRITPVTIRVHLEAPITRQLRRADMNSTVWESDDVERLDEPRQVETPAINSVSESEPSTTRIDGLKQLTLQLFREVQSITDVESLNVETGVDYYEEVRRFEVDLIMRALMQTAGHQRRAARL